MSFRSWRVFVSRVVPRPIVTDAVIADSVTRADPISPRQHLGDQRFSRSALRAALCQARRFRRTLYARNAIEAQQM